MQKNVLEVLRKLFSKQKVLEIHDVITAMHTTTRMTAYNYLKKLDYLSSYTHAGKYYTLKDIPKFDKDGLWHYGYDRKIQPDFTIIASQKTEYKAR